MTVRLDELYAPSALLESSRMLDKYVVEAVGTFALVATVGVGLCSGTPFAALGIGAVLLALVYAGGYRVGAHFNPAITLAATLWGRIPLRDAAAYWLAQLVGGLCAAIATRVTVGAGQSAAVMELMLSGRALVAAFAAELMFAFALAYVVCSCIESRRYAPNSLWHLAVGVAVVAGTVDFAALFGGVYVVGQLITGAFTAIAFLTFGSAGRSR
jgi:aquaporin Z